MIRSLRQSKIILAVCAGLFLFSFGLRVNAAEEIYSYTAVMDVYKDSSVLISETIVYDFGTEYRHGIYRYLPTDHPQKDRKIFLDRYVDIEVLKVEMDGADELFTVEKSSNQIYILIGDPNKTITGLHTYVISYRVSGGLSYFDDGVTELYWNVIGTEWGVPIRSTRITLNDPDELFTNFRACYAGKEGSQSSCDMRLQDNGSIVFTSGFLKPFEGITIAQALTTPKVTKNILERKKLTYFWIPALLIWFSVLSFFVYRYKTQFKVHKAVIAQYEPYKGFKPMYTGLLFDGWLDARDITAGIVHLAERGFLKIAQKKEKVFFLFDVDDYAITLLKPIAHIDSKFLREIVKLLFGGTPVEGNTVLLSELKKSTKRQKENLQLLAYLKKNLEQDLEDSGFFQVTIPTYVLVVLFIMVSSLVFGFAGVLTSIFSPNVLFIGLGILGSLFILSVTHRRRTLKGYEALWYLQGFKEFLSVTEKERYKFHNAPQKSPEQFMEYLPYAIAFGVEKEWADVFKDITIPNPTWYEGGGTHFSATNLTTSIGAFSTAFASSSGTSGSSGGGSAGGGGGGGGGGSW